MPGSVPLLPPALGELSPDPAALQDGRIRVPPALQPVVGTDIIAPPQAATPVYIGPNQPKRH